MNLQKNMLVSVVMATYNDPEHYLNLAINSILEQTYESLELIIIDDSTDIECIKRLQDFEEKDHRVKLVRSKTRKGFVKSLNMGISLASGIYIARMDSDDISSVDRIEKQVMYLQSHPTVNIVGTNIDIIDDSGKVTGKRNYIEEHSEIRKKAFFRNPLAHPTVMYRREDIIKLGLYDEFFLMAEDYELWLRAIKAGLIINNMPDILLKYRVCANYYKKRSKKNWKYNIKAKQKNFDLTFRNICGILFSILLYLMPQKIIQVLYDFDRKKLIE